MSLSHIDLTNPENFLEHTPHEWFSEMRNADPVHWHEGSTGAAFWCITKWKDLRTVSRDPGLFSSQRRGTNMPNPKMEEMMRRRAEQGGSSGPMAEMAKRARAGGGGGFPIMLMMDPPRHVQFRRMVQRSFTPRLVEGLEPHIRELAKKIVDGVVEKGECEFVTEVAADLPLQVICEMMGVPEEDRQEIFEITNRMIGFDDPELGEDQAERAMASMGMFAKAMKVAELYRENPQENLTSYLLHREVDGEKLSEIEYAAFFLLLCVAGNETTRTVTTNGMRLLMEHPDQLQRLVDDPSLIGSAVEEILRFEPAVHHFRRTATRDTEIRGRKIKENDPVLMWYPSANRDEEVFEDPDRFDVSRYPNEHLSFGIGEHFCLGANLARLELNAIFEEIIPRLRNPQFAGPVRRLRSNFINGVKEMRIRFEPGERADH
ncbi:MAG: cytochrome P450 [Deltaproteobacteria bacterium]|nr:cytochrome P450 [Deltaproteobacteria bacterium]